MQKTLHIVAFDIPWPANYGGAIVVFYHIKSMHQAGAKIILHCFQYGGRRPERELEKYCEKIYYYPRSKSPVYLFGQRPFIVQSRAHKELLEHLNKDKYPILMEGLHCSAFANDPSLKDRLKLIRMHNIEWQYYQNLADLENNPIKKQFFIQESKKLKSYEKIVLNGAAKILAISPIDFAYFQSNYSNVDYMPAFHPNEKVDIKLGKGDYALFHAKLSVKDNEASAIYLIEEIFSKTTYPFIIAGLEASKKLQTIVGQFKNIKLVENPTDKGMKELIQNAQINVLWSFQSAGIKLKLLHALFNGRFCLCNDHIAKNTGLESCCVISNDSEELLEQILVLKEKKFDKSHLNYRVQLLEKQFSNHKNALKTINLIANYVG